MSVASVRRIWEKYEKCMRNYHRRAVASRGLIFDASVALGRTSRLDLWCVGRASRRWVFPKQLDGCRGPNSFKGSMEARKRSSEAWALHKKATETQAHCVSIPIFQKVLVGLGAPILLNGFQTFDIIFDTLAWKERGQAGLCHASWYKKGMRRYEKPVKN